jgi:hypothetical protein
LILVGWLLIIKEKFLIDYHQICAFYLATNQCIMKQIEIYKYSLMGGVLLFEYLGGKRIYVVC